MTGSGVRIGSIVIDCDNFTRMMDFWQQALHYVPARPPEGGWAILKDPGGRGPNVSLNQTNEGHLEENRHHLDFYTDDQEGEVNRLMPPGASLNRSPDPGKTSFVFANPTGNRFLSAASR